MGNKLNNLVSFVPVVNEDESSFGDNDVDVIEVPDKSTTTTTTKKPSTAVSSTKQPFKPTRCENGEYLPHESDCNLYYICDQGHLLKQNCPPGLHWHDKNCDWPQYSNCVDGSRDPNAPTTSPKPTTTTVRTTRKPPPTIDPGKLYFSKSLFQVSLVIL